MTEFHVEAVRIGTVYKHPNADSLSITNVYASPDGSGGYPVIFKTGDYAEGSLAVYVPVDAVVPETPEWSFLWGNEQNPPPRKRRIKAKKLRGVFSMGVLTAAPAGVTEGQDVAELLGITRYEDEAEVAERNAVIKRGRQPKLGWWGRLKRSVLKLLGLYREPGTPQHGLPAPKLKHLPGYYDIEPFRKYAGSWFEDGEEIVITEKIHGQNASFVVDHEGKFHLKSRTRWREFDHTDPSNAWARVAANYGLPTKLAPWPGYILYGEAYGNFSDCPYGATNEAPGFVAFDVFDSNKGRWLNWDEFVNFCEFIGIDHVPVLAKTAWLEADGAATYAPLAEGKTTLNDAGHVREGFVIKPRSGRCLRSGQRILLKMHGEGFLTRDESKTKAPKPQKAKAPRVAPLPDPNTTEFALAV